MPDLDSTKGLIQAGPFIDQFNLPGNRRSGTSPHLCLSADDQTLFAAINSNRLLAIDWRSRRTRWSVQELTNVGAIAAAPGGQWLAVGGHRYVCLRDTSTGELLHEFCQ